MTDQYGPIQQLRLAWRNIPALLMGVALGAFVPIATCLEAHSELRKWREGGDWNLEWALVIGGAAYSAKTVWQWGERTFRDSVKATGFVILLEGVMVFSPFEALSGAALCYLVVINAIATGCLLALRDHADLEQAHQPTSARGEGARENPALSNATEQSAAPTLPLAATLVSPLSPFEFDTVGAGAGDAEVPALPSTIDTETSVAHPAIPAAPPLSLVPLLTHPTTRRRARHLTQDALYQQALSLVESTGWSSTSALQRQLSIGYNRAAKLTEELQRNGIIGHASTKTGGRPMLALVSEQSPAITPEPVGTQESH